MPDRNEGESSQVVGYDDNVQEGRKLESDAIIKGLVLCQICILRREILRAAC